MLSGELCVSRCNKEELSKGRCYSRQFSSKLESRPRGETLNKWSNWGQD